MNKFDQDRIAYWHESHGCKALGYKYDVIIIGGGPAGLSTALGLGIHNYSVLIFDTKESRAATNSHTYGVSNTYGVLTGDRLATNKFMESAENNIRMENDAHSGYENIHFQNSEVRSVSKKPSGIFQVNDANGENYYGMKLVIATGVTHVLPDIKGFVDVWGKAAFPSTIFSGFMGHGVDSAANAWGFGRRVSILATGGLTEPSAILHHAVMMSRLAASIHVHCNGDEDLYKKLQKACDNYRIKISIYPGRVYQLKLTGLGAGSSRERGGVGLQIYHDSGFSTDGFLLTVPKSRINGSFHEQLGLETDSRGFIKINLDKKPPFETSVSGVFAVGDCANAWMRRSIQTATSNGHVAAGTISAELGKEILKKDAEEFYGEEVKEEFYGKGVHKEFWREGV